MSQFPVNQPKPHIMICSAANKDLPAYDGVISALLAGIEEEEIPFNLTTCLPQGVNTLAYQASQSSVLGVGIGIERNLKMAVHYIKMPPLKPLFSLSGIEANLEEIRVFGANAAKLVKGYPFKMLDKSYLIDSEKSDVIKQT